MSFSLSRTLLSSRPKKPAYEYVQLRSDLEEIRLLSIKTSAASIRNSKNKAHAPGIQCHIIQAPLMQSPSFTALSYAWGTSKPSREIELDGCLMLVSQNLLDALVELQADESTSQKLFWIDAICINQRDIAEKSTQVQMMGDIYRRASEVIAWLGKEDSGAVLALESIASIHECQVFSQNGLRAAIATAEISQDRDAAQEAAIAQVKSSLDNLLHRFDFDAVVKAVGKLIEREWWRRLWVIQELVLSRQAYIRCGHWAISWNSFEYFLDLCELFMLCFPADPSFYAAYVINYKTFILSKCRRQVQSGRPPTMFQLLEMMITMAVRETTDPRDRVYALLGFSEDRVQLNVRPNYSLNCVQVYMNITETLLLKHGLVVLSYCSNSQKSKLRLDGLSSWALDLSGTVPDPLRGSASSIFYRASGHSSSDLSVRSFKTYVSPHSVLEVQSIAVDTVAVASDERPSPRASFDSSKAKLLRKWLRKIPCLDFRREAMYNGIWRVLIANRISRRGQEASREAEPEDEEGFKALLSRDEVSLASSNDAIIDYFYSAWVRTVERCIFTSASGRVGLGSSTIRSGDYIVILLGADMPFIVRPVGNDHCQIIGEAYIHGMMQGEALQGSPRIGPLYIR